MPMVFCSSWLQARRLCPCYGASGVITLVVFLAMIPLIKLHDPPDWVFVVWLILVVLLCFSTLFFVVQRGYCAMVRHKHASAKS
jgi:hypothetical protein